MKKLLSVILAALCLFSVFACTASAATTNIFEDISDEFQDQSVYAIVYTTGTLSQVVTMYVPNPSASFNGPGYVTVSKDTPIAIDYDFVCWKDGAGHEYQPGDKIYVNGTVTLTPVWQEKTDNDSHTLRTVKAAIESLTRIIQKIFGIFKDYQEFDATYVAPTETAAP